MSLDQIDLENLMLDRAAAARAEKRARPDPGEIVDLSAGED